MLAMLLASMVLMIAWSVYLAMTRQYALQEDVRQFQYRVTNAAAMLKNEVARAGYLGCPSLQDGFPIEAPAEVTLSAATKIIGTENQFTVKHAAFPPAAVLDVSTDHTIIKTDLGQRFKTGQLVLMVDCRHAEIKRITHASRDDPFQFLRFDTPLISEFDAGAEISPLEINRYSVTNHALVKQAVSGRESILIEGIESMTLTYHYALGKLIGVTFKLQARQGKQIKNWYTYAPVS